MEVRFTISSEEELAPFLACLALGTLQAIRDDIISAQVGIWSLTPIVLQRNARLSSVPKSILDVYSMCDELSAIRKLRPDYFDTLIEELIDELRTELSKIEDPNWHLYWESETREPGAD